jgi:RNA polymerase sigma factor (sigma-70 family)
MQAISTAQPLVNSAIAPLFNKHVDSVAHPSTLADKPMVLQKELQQLRPQIMTYCLGYLRHTQDAEEACQDTMLNAMSALSKFENRASLKTWVMKIAYHVCTNYFRKNRAQKDLFDEYDESVFACTDPLFDQDNPEITALLASLSTVQQEILRYRFVDELSLKDISIILGYKLSCVKMNYYRALDKLQKSSLL